MNWFSQLFGKQRVKLLEEHTNKFKQEIGDLVDSTIYRFVCVDIEISEKQINISSETFPLEQNCDYLEIYHPFSPDSNLQVWYDDGSKFAHYSPAFQNIAIDEEHLTITLYLSSEYLDKDCISVYLEQVEIIFKDRVLWQRTKAFLSK